MLCVDPLTWDRVLMDRDTGYFFVCRGKTGERNATSGWRQTHRQSWRGRRASPAPNTCSCALGIEWTNRSGTGLPYRATPYLSSLRSEVA